VAQRVVPFVGYADADAAIDWLCAAFGATEDRESRQTAADGTIGHAELDLGDGALVFVATPSPNYEGPKAHREHCEAAARWQDNPWVVDGLFVEVDDVEAHFTRAREHGARILRVPEEPGVGFRLYSAEDPEGHRWMFGQRL
jgi:PhnB protein